MDNMILGRYIPGNSIIHRLDPRSKLVAMILLIIIAFWANNPITNLILFIATGIFVILSEVPLSFFIKGLRSMFFSDCFYNPFSTVLYLWWSRLVRDGVYKNHKLWY